MIQRFQSKILRTVVNAPWYVSNRLLHNDLHIPSITDEIQRVVTKHNDKTHSHASDLIEHLYNNGPTDSRLRRTWPADLVQRSSTRSDGGLPRKPPTSYTLTPWTDSSKISLNPTCSPRATLKQCSIRRSLDGGFPL